MADAIFGEAGVSFLWQGQHLMILDCHSSWQAHLVMLDCPAGASCAEIWEIAEERNVAFSMQNALPSVEKISSANGRLQFCNFMV